MIVCHCQNITDRDIDAAIDWMRRADPETLITPGKVYRALGKAADCGGCMPLFLSTMRANAALEIPPGPPTLTQLPTRSEPDERRHQGPRVSQQGPA